jgi:hypothetical protein
MERLKKIQEARKSKKGSGGGGWSNFFYVAEDSKETIRILEDMDEIVTNQQAEFHKLEPLGKSKSPRWEICLDQDPAIGQKIGAECPGCDLNAEDSEEAPARTLYFVNVIWRNAPVREKKGNKWVDTDKREDQLAVWRVYQFQLQEELENAYETFKSLTNRDFVVKRTGTGYETTYTIQPATNDEGDSVKTPLSDADKELAEKKADLTEKVKLVPLSEWGKVKAKKKDEESKDDSEAAASPFLNRNRDAD